MYIFILKYNLEIDVLSLDRLLVDAFINAIVVSKDVEEALGVCLELPLGCFLTLFPVIHCKNALLMNI